MLQASVLLLRSSVAEVFIGQASVANLSSGGYCCTKNPVAALRLPRVRIGLSVLTGMGLPHTRQAAGLAGRRGAALSSVADVEAALSVRPMR